MTDDKNPLLDELTFIEIPSGSAYRYAPTTPMPAYTKEITYRGNALESFWKDELIEIILEMLAIRRNEKEAAQSRAHAALGR